MGDIRRALMLGASNGGDTVAWELLINDTFSEDVNVPKGTPKEYTITGKYKNIFIVW